MILFKDNVERIAEDPETIAELKAMGYRALESDACFEDVTETASEAEETPLALMTVKELREIAKARGIKGSASLSKANLIDILG